MKQLLLGFSTLLACSSFGQVSLVKDFYTGSSGQFINSGSPSPLIIHQNKLMLCASDDQTMLAAKKLFELNDLSGNVTAVSSLNLGMKRGPRTTARIYEGAVSSGTNLFFFSQQPAALNDILYVYDGSSVLALDTVPLSFLNPYTLLPLPGNKILYMGHSAATGFELFISDGTIAGTTLVKDINPGTASSFGSTIPMLIGFDFNNQVYFLADNGINGLELWKTDGTGANTQLFFESNSSGSSFAPGLAWTKNTNRFLVHVVGGTQKGIVTSDGTSVNTQFLHSQDLVNLFSWDANSYIGKFDQPTNKMYYAIGGNSNIKIYQTLGVPGDTIKLYDGPGHPLAYGTEFQNELYFLSQGATSGESQLEKLDVTGNTFETIKTFQTADGSAVFGPMIQNDTLLFFMQMDLTDAGGQYYISDGTSSGTNLLYSFDASPLNGGPHGATGFYTNFGTDIVFSARRDSDGHELWKLGGNTTPLSVTDLPGENTFEIYPNPTKSTVTILTEETLSGISVLNPEGKVVGNIPVDLQNKQVRFDEMPNGVYTLRISTPGRTFNQKVVVMRD